MYAHPPIVCQQKSIVADQAESPPPWEAEVVVEFSFELHMGSDTTVTHPYTPPKHFHLVNSCELRRGFVVK